MEILCVMAGITIIVVFVTIIHFLGDKIGGPPIWY